MTNVSDPDDLPGNLPKPIEPSRPGRGAFLTPKSEIEKAKPYIPDMGEKEDGPEESPDQPTYAKADKEG